MEAALLLPSFFIVLALLLQPACILYSKVVMNSVAQETCRVYGISSSTGAGRYAEDRYQEFMLRRLKAVPHLALFHVGGDEGWEFTLSRSDTTAYVKIEHEVKLLPLLGIAASPLGAQAQNNNLLVSAEAEMTVRPSWVKGGYHDWQAQWTE